MRKRLVWLWAIVPIIAVSEVVSLWQIIQQEPSPSEWKEAAGAIAKEKQKHDLVVIAPHWATQGRMYLKGQIPLTDFGRFDTTQYDRILELSVNRARAPETEGLVLESEKDFNRISVRRYKLPPRARVLYDFVEEAKTQTESRFPKPKIYIDHWFFPRLVIPLRLSSTSSSLTFTNVPLDGTLRGYGIIAYREGRFNKGKPVTISIYVNGKKLGEDQIHNFGPLEPFEFPINGTGNGTVRFEIKATDNLRRRFGLAADVRRKQSEPR